MLTISIALTLAPFLSLPYFLFNSYVQPFPVLLGWCITFLSLDLRINKRVFFAGIILIAYISILGFAFQHSSFYANINVFFAYFVALISFLLFYSLFGLTLNQLVRFNISVSTRIKNACLALIFFNFGVSIFQLLPTFDLFISSFKPKHLFLGSVGLASSLRGLSGILPEPSYVGGFLGMLFLIIFWLSFSHFFFFKTLPLRSSAPLVSPANFWLNAYSAHFFYFLSFRYNQFILFSVFFTSLLAFSPTSLIVLLALLSLLLIPFVYRLFMYRISLRLISFMFLLFCFLFSLLSLAFVFFPDSRIPDLFRLLMSGDINFLISSDRSTSDRYSSSIVGLFSILHYPFGLGLNTHGFLLANCTNEFVKAFDLLCDTVYTSTRNHNVSATILSDGGIFSWIFLIYSVFTLWRVRLSSLAHDSRYLIALSLVLSTFSVFIVLPAPLGSPFLWAPLALLLQVTSFTLINSPIATPSSAS